MGAAGIFHCKCFADKKINNGKEIFKQIIKSQAEIKQQTDYDVGVAHAE